MKQYELVVRTKTLGVIVPCVLPKHLEGISLPHELCGEATSEFLESLDESQWSLPEWSMIRQATGEARKQAEEHVDMQAVHDAKVKANAFQETMIKVMLGPDALDEYSDRNFLVCIEDAMELLTHILTEHQKEDLTDFLTKYTEMDMPDSSLRTETEHGIQDQFQLIRNWLEEECQPYLDYALERSPLTRTLSVEVLAK